MVHIEAVAVIGAAIATLHRRTADVLPVVLLLGRFIIGPELAKSAYVAFLTSIGQIAAVVQGGWPNAAAFNGFAPDDQLFHKAPETDAYEFRKDFVRVLAHQIAKNFYEYDYKEDVALDAISIHR